MTIEHFRLLIFATRFRLLKLLCEVLTFETLETLETPKNIPPRLKADLMSSFFKTLES